MLDLQTITIIDKDGNRNLTASSGSASNSGFNRRDIAAHLTSVGMSDCWCWFDLLLNNAIKNTGSFCLSSFTELGVLTFILMCLPFGWKMTATTQVIIFMVKDEEGKRCTTFMSKIKCFPRIPQQSSVYISRPGVVSQAYQGYLLFLASEAES